jgi:hypothetical protein
MSLLYTANGLMLHGVSDSSGRSVTFNYGKNGIQSLTQTWMSNLEGITKTWSVGDNNNEDGSVKYAHAVGVKSAKFLPGNALIREYTSEMAECDKFSAHMFGGPAAWRSKRLRARRARHVISALSRRHRWRRRKGCGAATCLMRCTPRNPRRPRRAACMCRLFSSHSVSRRLPMQRDLLLSKLGNQLKLLRCFISRTFRLLLKVIGERSPAVRRLITAYKHSHIEFYKETSGYRQQQ